MKKTRSTDRKRDSSQEMLPEYRFNYKKARPNRFATRAASGSTIRMLAGSSTSIDIDDLIAAKKLVGQIGSIEKVKETLAALARLS